MHERIILNLHAEFDCCFQNFLALDKNFCFLQLHCLWRLIVFLVNFKWNSMWYQTWNENMWRPVLKVYISSFNMWFHNFFVNSDRVWKCLLSMESRRIWHCKLNKVFSSKKVTKSSKKIKHIHKSTLPIIVSFFFFCSYLFTDFRCICRQVW